MASALQRLVGQTAIYGLSSIIGRVLNYLLVPLYTRVFLPQEYGIVTELYAYVALFIAILNLGMDTAFLRFSRKGHPIDHVFGTALATVLLTSVTFLGIMLWQQDNIAESLKIAEHPEYIVWFAWVVAIDAISAIPFARLRAENKAKKFALLKLLGIGVNIGLNLFFILLCPILYREPDSWAYPLISGWYSESVRVGWIFIANLAASGLSLALLFPELLKVRLRLDPKLNGPMFRYAAPVVLIGIAGIVNETLDRILMNYLLPLDDGAIKAEIGIYGACYKLSIIMTLAVQAFRYAAEPFFFAEADQKDSRKTYATVMTWFSLVLGAIFLTTLLFLDVIKRFIGSEFHEGLHLVPILLLANLVLGLYYNLSVWFKLTDKTMMGAYVATFGALITIVLNMLWIPEFSYTGSAWATLITYVVMTILSYVLGRKHYPVPYQVGKILLYLGLALGLYFASVAIGLEEGWLKLGVHAVLLSLYLGIVIAVERPFQKGLFR